MNVRLTPRPPPNEDTAASLPLTARFPVCNDTEPTPTFAVAYINPYALESTVTVGVFAVVIVVAPVKTA